MLCFVYFTTIKKMGEKIAKQLKDRVQELERPSESICHNCLAGTQSPELKPCNVTL